MTHNEKEVKSLDLGEDIYYEQLHIVELTKISTFRRESRCPQFRKWLGFLIARFIEYAELVLFSFCFFLRKRFRGSFVISFV